MPARRFTPEYWRGKYESYRLLQDVRQVPVKRESAPKSFAPMGPPPTRWRWLRTVRWGEEWTQMKSLMHRAFFSKLRNRVNVLTTMVEAPLLAAMIAIVLRYNESGKYDFAGAYHIPIYLFLAVTVAMFLGLTNSADDIIRDRTVLQRERNLRIRLPYYIFAKTATLCLFALVQCVLFLLIGDYILQIRGMFWLYLGYTSLTAFCGVALGLLISSLVADAKTAVNIVPLILIPQIIMGGALIKYEEMNRNLDFVYTIKRMMAEHPGERGRGERHAQQTPSAFYLSVHADALELRGVGGRAGQAEPAYFSAGADPESNSDLANRDERLRQQGKELSAIQRDRLDGLKELLAMISGLEAKSPAGINEALLQIDQMMERLPLEELSLPNRGAGVTAEQLYVNQKISDLVSKAEMEQSDYRNEELQRPELNVFFGPYRYVFHQKISMHIVNVSVLVGFSMLVLGLLHASLHRELQR